MTTAARSEQVSAGEVLFVALELGNSRWKVGSTIGLGQKPREKTVQGGDVAGVLEEIQRARKRFGLGGQTQVVSCYEAGRDGFWLHRKLVSEGVANIVIDPASMGVDRRKKRAKTDRIDLGKLLNHLVRWHGGESKVWSVVNVPAVGDEDARWFHREQEELSRERTAITNRIKGLLVTQGVRIPVGSDLVEQLEGVRLWDGSRLPPQLRARICREHQRLELIRAQMKELAKQRREALRRTADVRMEQVRKLRRLRGVGDTGAWIMVMEFFAWRKFRNRRQVASLAGLTSTPYDSGDGSRDQGIDKAGNRRVRVVAVELAWCWLRFQPRSELAVWFEQRFAGRGKKGRRIGIVALARKLLIAWWRYLEQDIVPAGAVLSAV
jgi:transposase